MCVLFELVKVTVGVFYTFQMKKSQSVANLCNVQDLSHQSTQIIFHIDTH